MYIQASKSAHTKHDIYTFMTSCLFRSLSLFLALSFSSSFSFSFSISIYLSIYLSSYLSIYLSIYLTIYISRLTSFLFIISWHTYRGMLVHVCVAYPSFHRKLCLSNTSISCFYIYCIYFIYLIYIIYLIYTLAYQSMYAIEKIFVFNTMHDRSNDVRRYLFTVIFILVSSSSSFLFFLFLSFLPVAELASTYSSLFGFQTMPLRRRLPRFRYHVLPVFRLARSATIFPSELYTSYQLVASYIIKIHDHHV